MTTPGSKRYITILAIVFVAALITAVLLGMAYYDQQRDLFRIQEIEELDAIAQLKVDQIVAWREQLASDLAHLSDDALAGNGVDAWAASDRALAPPAVVGWLSENVDARGFDEILVIQPASGRSMSGKSSAPTPQDLTLAQDAVTEGTTVFSQPYRHDGRILLDAAAPMSTPGTAIIIRSDLQDFLYPLIQSWPIPTKSAETLLVRRVGDEALFMNDLRFKKDAALNLSMPVDTPGLLSGKAITTGASWAEGVDYRKVPVLGDLNKVPGTDWYLISKMDLSEVDEPVSQAARVSAFAVSLFGIAMLAGLAAAWRSRSAAQYRTQAELAERFAFLSRYANDAVIRSDSDLRIVEVNDRASAMYGYTRDELVGMTFMELDDPSQNVDAQAIRQAIVDTPGGLLFEVPHVRKDGSSFPVEISATAFGDPAAPGFVSVIRDITERKAAQDELRAHRDTLELLVDERTEELASTNEELTATNEELQSINEELGAANEEVASVNEELAATNEELACTNEELHAATTAKSEFLANMSHELRTPLNSIIGFTGVILRGMAGELTDEQRSQLTMVKGSGERLLGLVNDMLDLSRIEAGRATLDLSAPLLTEVVASAASELEPLALERDLPLVVAPVLDDVQLYTDEQKLHQILVNLLANAIKFTDHGSVTIAATSSAHDTVTITVADTGVGISPVDMAAIFDEFIQVPRDGAKPQGTGLGLAISRRLAGLLGGTLTAESVPGDGSVFTLVIPRILHSDGQ